MKVHRQCNRLFGSLRDSLYEAYDKGYEQAKSDYEKPAINWIAEPREGGIQFKCDGCNSYAIANYPHCPWCGCPVEKENRE